jgi:soluble cytochrome b562
MAKNDEKLVENVVAAIEKRFGSKTPGGPGGGAQAVETPSGANDAILNAQIDRLVETLSNNMATVVGTVFCSSPAKAIQDLKPGMFFQELEKQLQTVVAGQASPKAETKQSVDVVLSASDSTLSETVAKLSEASPEGLESLNGFITQLDTISKMEVGNLDEVVTSLNKINDN